MHENDAPLSYHFTVDADAEPMRFDRYLADQPVLVQAHLSRTRIKALMEDGRVAMNGAIIRDASAKIIPGAAISLSIPPALPAKPEGEAKPLAIIHEDAALIIINKPAGLVVHPAAGHASGTLVNALIAHCGDSLSGVGGVRRPGIVHRLDKETTGLLVVAKTDQAHHGLAALFADHGRTKPFLREYLALVWGAPERMSGVINAPIARHATQREKMAVVRDEGGREAITHWRVVKTFGTDKNGAPLASLVACRLETGRTHQIRVHLTHIGHPVMGDPVYGTGFKTKEARLMQPARAALACLGRQALHAAVLGFPHPVSEEMMTFTAEPPRDFLNLQQELEKLPSTSR